MKNTMNLAKCTINCKVIAITNWYQIAVGKVYYLVTIDTKMLLQIINAWQKAQT